MMSYFGIVLLTCGAILFALAFLALDGAVRKNSQHVAKFHEHLLKLSRRVENHQIVIERLDKGANHLQNVRKETRGGT